MDGVCYSYHTEQLSWPDAQGVCEGNGGFLLTLDTATKKQIIGKSVITICYQIYIQNTEILV